MPSRMDEIISQGMGMAKAAQARFSGLLGVFRKLAEQHGQISALLDRMTDRPDKRADLWPRIRGLLLAHERGERDTVFAELRLYDTTRRLAEQHARDADLLEQLVAALDAEDLASDAWGNLFDQLVDRVEQHVRQEESEIFPEAQATLGPARARALEPELLAAQARQDG